MRRRSRRHVRGIASGHTLSSSPSASPTAGVCENWTDSMPGVTRASTRQMERLDRHPSHLWLKPVLRLLGSRKSWGYIAFWPVNPSNPSGQHYSAMTQAPRSSRSLRSAYNIFTCNLYRWTWPPEAWVAVLLRKGALC